MYPKIKHMQFVIKGIGCDNLKRLRHGRDRRVVGFITTITTNICEYEFHSGEVYSDWRQVGSFLRITPSIKLTAPRFN